MTLPLNYLFLIINIGTRPLDAGFFKSKTGQLSGFLDSWIEHWSMFLHQPMDGCIRTVNVTHRAALENYPTATSWLIIFTPPLLPPNHTMSGSQRRLSLLANHLNSSRGMTTNAAATTASTKQPLKETFRNRQDYKHYLPIQTRYTCWMICFIAASNIHL